MKDNTVQNQQLQQIIGSYNLNCVVAPPHGKLWYYSKKNDPPRSTAAICCNICQLSYRCTHWSTASAPIFSWTLTLRIIAVIGLVETATFYWYIRSHPLQSLNPSWRWKSLIPLAVVNRLFIIVADQRCSYVGISWSPPSSPCSCFQAITGFQQRSKSQQGESWSWR